MSKLIYIASDVPLKDMPNPHYKPVSINEALAIGMNVPSFLLEDGTDRDEPGMLLWTDVAITIDTEQDTFDDGGHDDDFSISVFDKIGDVNIRTEKKYCASLDWRYTKGRAQQVIAYIKELLEHTDEIEIWNIWLGIPYPPPRIKKSKIYIDGLTPQVLKEIDAVDSCQEDPVAHYAPVPNSWGISEEELYPDTHYCFTIANR